MVFRKLEFRNKNNKLLYYIQAIAITQLVPAIIFSRMLHRKLTCGSRPDIGYIRKRVNYYNKLSAPCELSADASALADIKRPKRRRVYHFDSQEYLRFFNAELNVKFLWGD